MITRILFFSICFALISSLALALVATPHDFSALGGEPCAYCHSVHNAVGGLGRPAFMGELPEITKVYCSVTLDISLTVGNVEQSDAPLCLTCHDGAYARSQGYEFSDGTLLADLIENTKNDITSDLSNDHPSGFVFDSSIDDEIKDPTLEGVNVVFGPNRNEMWCSTCHDVHNNSIPPFLVVSNALSALCLDCHIK